MNIRHHAIYRVFTIVLTLILTLGIFLPVAATQANAASYVICNSITDIPENIDVFNTIAKGSISAVKANGTWYYQFKRSGYQTVRIKCTAFSSGFTNRHLPYDNKTLNKCLAQNSNTNHDEICYYHTRTSRDFAKYKVYTTSMYRFRLGVQAGDKNHVKVKSNLLNSVQFTYQDKVIGGRGYGSYYMKPVLSLHYLKALKRTTNVDSIQPVITLQVDNNKKGTAYLSTYSLSGKGEAKTSTNVTNCISVVYSASKALATAATGNYVSGFVSLSSIVQKARTFLSKTSSQYNTGESITMTRGEKYIISTKLNSPIRVSKAGDWVQYELNLGGSRKGATFTVNFAFK